MLLCFATIAGALQAGESNVIRPVFENADGTRVGTLWIMNNERGPDMPTIKFNRLQPNTVYGVQLTESAQVGSIPSVLVGQVETASGIARSDDFGTRAGLMSNGAPLTYFRVYRGRAGAVQSVFGTQRDAVNGGAASTTVVFGACTTCTDLRTISTA